MPASIFGHFPRVIYDRNPLKSVICQLRFQPVLRIAVNPPAEFQDLLLPHLPGYSRSADLFQELNSEVLPPIIGNALRAVSSMGPHKFTSEDEKTIVTLTSEFVAIEQTEYRRWEDFRSVVQLACQALRDTYGVNTLTRVGLRYRNLIDPTELEEIRDLSLRDLLHPWILAELEHETVSEFVVKTNRTTEIQIPDLEGAMVRVRNSADRAENDRIGTYSIDSDFFIMGKVTFDELEEILGIFNQYARDLFRWSIKDPLHNALQPRSVD